ncbi:MAG: helix-turn-helix transcriptional regulator [Magnetococcales bacterium]|nr:helix-turn-helix transcriptional regulator [Magnetococcales bacterium]
MTKKNADKFKLRPELLQDGDAYIEERLLNPEFKKIWYEESLKVQVALRVHESRKKKGLSQEKLAKEAKTTQKVISKIEHGEVSIGLDLLQRIAHVLDFRVELSLR